MPTWIPAASTTTFPPSLHDRFVGCLGVVWAVLGLRKFVLVTVTLTVTAKSSVGVTVNCRSACRSTFNRATSLGMLELGGGDGFLIPYCYGLCTTLKLE